MREQRLQDWQKFVSTEITTLFKVFYRINFGVLGLIVVLWSGQAFCGFIPGWTGDHPQSLVTEKVVLALIAASAAQLGALAFGVGRGLFKPPPGIDVSDE
jgi:hypothetical protein